MSKAIRYVECAHCGETVGTYYVTCPYCGRKYKELRLSEREWVCEHCGRKHDRDVNAALNIRDEALRLNQPGQ